MNTALRVAAEHWPSSPTSRPVRRSARPWTVLRAITRLLEADADMTPGRRPLIHLPATGSRRQW